MKTTALTLRVALLAVAICAAHPSSRAGTLDEEFPEVVFLPASAPAVAAKALELGNDPVRIYEFVRNKLEFQNYFGLMKGPEATLLSGGGNDYDLAALLVSLMRAAGVPARFARGRIWVPAGEATAWTGMDTVDAALQYLNDGAKHIWIEDAGVALAHVWVEVHAPMAFYRGRGADPAMRGRTWIPLDPSYKLSAWSEADPNFPIGDTPELALDYTGPTGLYSKVQPKLPSELFENQIREHLAAEGATVELEDLRMHGSIIEEAPGVLPSGLPYRFSSSSYPGGSWPIRRAASLSELHVGPFSYWPNEEYRYRSSIKVCATTAFTCALGTTPPLLDIEVSSVAWEGKPVVLVFERPAGQSASCGVQLTPVVFAGGVESRSATAVDACSYVNVAVSIERPGLGAPGAGRDSVSNHTVAAGGVYLASFDLWGASSVRTRAKSQALIDALETYPVATGHPNGPFIDLDGDQTKDPNEPYLADDLGAQRDLTGGLLDLANAWYWEQARAAESIILALHHSRSGFMSGAGLISAGKTIDYLYEIPFAIRSANLLLDIQGLQGLAVSRETGTPVATSEPEWYLVLHTLSALEHGVWEEVAGFEAVSTVKGFQLGREVADENLLVLKSLADANAATSSCSASTCANLDFWTHCTITASFPSIDHPLTGCSAQPGVTTELRILERSNFQYDHGWEGYVYFRATADSLEFAISPTGQLTAGGGYTTDFFITQPWAMDWNAGALVDSSRFDREFWSHNSPYAQRTYAGDPVSVLNGNYYSVDTDIAIAGRGGMDLRLVRSYNARLSSYAGPIGHGWTHTFDQHLRLDDGEVAAGDERVVWQTETGAEVPWNDPNSAAQPLTLSAQPWVHDTLVRNAGGSYSLTTKDGMVYRFHPASAGVAKLDFIRDRNGNTITCHYDGTRLDSVADTAGRVLDFVYDDVNRTVEIQDADWFGGSGGRTWRYQLDARGDLIEYWDPEQTAKEAEAPGSGQPWRYTYYADALNDDMDHNLKCWIRPQGGRTPGSGPALCGAGAQGHAWMHFAYYANDTVYKHTDAIGHETSFSYNFLAKRTDVTNPDGSVERYFYDAYGNVTRHESGRGVVREYEFDAAKREQVGERDGLGFESTASYDTRGNRIGRVDRLGESEIWTYNDFGQVLSHTNRRGHRSEWVYDARGNLLVERALVGGALRTLREHAYDSFGNRIETVAHRDLGQELAPVRTRFEYRANGVGLRRTIDGLGKTTRLVLDELARPTRVERDRTVLRNGSSIAEPVSVETEYDRLDRARRSVGPDGTISELEFDANGLVEEVRTMIPQTLEERAEEIHQYDAMDRRVATTNALGQTATFAHDGRDRLISATSPLGHTTTRAYDFDGNLVAEVDPSGATARIEYDAEGRPERAIDPLGRVSRTEYDPEGRVLKQVGPGERTLATFELDEEGNPTSRSDAEQHVYTTEFDELGRPLSVVGPLGEPEEGTTTLDYDLTGLLLSRTDAEARTIALRYDALGRLVEQKDGLGRSTYSAYDELGNLVERVDGAGERLRFEHDARGRVVRRTSAGSAGTSAIDDVYRYDGFGRLVVARNAHTTLTYAYDALDRVQAVTDGVSGTAQLRYDADGRTVQAIYPNKPTYGYPEGVSVHYVYNARGQLAAVVDPVAGIFSLEHDAAGRPVRRIDPTGVERRVVYDDAGDGYGFVERVEITKASSPAVNESYAYRDYDLLGNPGSIDYVEHVPDPDVVSTTAISYDSRSRVRSVAYPAGEGTESFEYDRTGNRTRHINRQNEDRRYVIDAAQQLGEIRDFTTDDLVERFVYDGAGRRRQRLSSGGALVESYAYDAAGALAEYTRAADGYGFDLHYDALGYRRERSDTAPSQALYFGEWAEHRGGVRRRKVFGSGLGAPLAEIAVGSSGTPIVRGLYEDGTANVTHVASKGAGALLFEAPRRYEAFGARLNPATTQVERSFAGRPTEGASSLLWMGARHYDPSTGTFLQVDPLVVETSEPYAYALQNPYRFWDPTGLRGNTINTSLPSYGSASRSASSEPSFGSALAQIGSGVALAAAGFVPYLGDALDVYSLGSPSSTAFERTASGVSLAVNAWTAGLAPNAGPIIRGSDDVYAGVRELSQTLIDAGVGRTQRLEVINSFQGGSIRGMTATGNESFIRYFGGAAAEHGRFLTPSFPSSGGARDALALPPSNLATGIRAFGVEPGARFFEGAVAPRFGRPGGGSQVFVPDLGALR